ncbi:hypothetical protein C9374_008445 [Naegleria lovaniensis]|uniref:EF-hand domain-containing protein n=1 Tax=Naegleria lovaniensis TaxID=51637 RepID=A0AA88GJ45_NAELO|nr:uncharacterized protein C9374_008445 [Naegleria lovaniensis]KAG2378302.1 hypothetical protein C9374_008445 [Naegleria lovaniensis]
MKRYIERDDHLLKAQAIEEGFHKEGNLYITRNGIDVLWNKYDHDQDGYLQNDEISQFLLDFIHAIHNRSVEELENQRRLRKLKAGTIDPSLSKRYQERFEQISMQTELFKSKISDLKRDLDKDGDGLVSEEQFIEYLENFNLLSWKEQFIGGENVKFDFQDVPSFSTSPPVQSIPKKATPSSPRFGSSPSSPSSKSKLSSSPSSGKSTNSSVSTQESSRREEKEIDKDGYAVYRFEFYEIRLPPSWKKGLAYPSGVPIFSSPLECDTVKEDILCTQIFTKNSTLEEQFKRLQKGSSKVTNFKVIQPMTMITDRKIQPYKHCAFCILQFNQTLPVNNVMLNVALYQKIVIIQDNMGLMHQLKYTTNLLNNHIEGETVFDRAIREGLVTKSLLEVDTKEVKLSKELIMSYPSVMHMEVQDGYVFMFHPVQILSNNTEKENFNAKILLPLNFEEQVQGVISEILQSSNGVLVSSEEIQVGEFGYLAKQLEFSYQLDSFKIGQICVFVKSPSCHYYFSYTSSLGMMSRDLFDQFIKRLSFSIVAPHLVQQQANCIPKQVPSQKPPTTPILSQVMNLSSSRKKQQQQQSQTSQ